MLWYWISNWNILQHASHADRNWQSIKDFISSISLISSTPIIALRAMFSSKIIVALSGPLFIYLKIYFIDHALLHHSTFICAWYFTTKSILYGKKNLLSSLTPFLSTYLLSSLCLYNGKPFWFVVVSTHNFFEKCFEQPSLVIHGTLIFAYPHGPCIINCDTAAYPIGSKWQLGSSTEMILSISLGIRYFSYRCRKSRMWACGRPLFWNSTV